MIFALVNENVVQNMIIAEQEFIDSISSEWQFCIDVTEMENQPCIGWSYDSVNDLFIDPNPVPEE